MSCAGSGLKDEEPQKWDTRLVLSAPRGCVSPGVYEESKTELSFV